METQRCNVPIGMAGRQPQIDALPLQFDDVGAGIVAGQVATVPGIRKQLAHCGAVGIAAMPQPMVRARAVS